MEQDISIDIILLIGTLCGSIQATSPASHSVYEEYDELNHRLEVSCIEMRKRNILPTYDVKGYEDYNYVTAESSIRD